MKKTHQTKTKTTASRPENSLNRVVLTHEGRLQVAELRDKIMEAMRLNIGEVYITTQIDGHTKFTQLSVENLVTGIEQAAAEYAETYNRDVERERSTEACRVA